MNCPACADPNPESGPTRRPALRYHGGKWRLAPWIIGHLPPHRVYVEPYGGAASVLMRKPRSYAEVYGDLDDEVVNVFRVLRDPVTAGRLAEQLRLTPFARSDFEKAYEPAEDPVERARRSIVKAFMGFGSSSMYDPRPAGMRTSSSMWRPPTSFRADSNRSGTTPACDWSRYPAVVRQFTDRLSGVVIEQRPALELIAQHDKAETLHYVDPPYVHSTRSGIVGRAPKSRHGYRFEMSDEEHRTLALALHGAQGMVALSGYQCPLYEELYGSWERHDRETFADKAKPRVESLWLNPTCQSALERARSQGVMAL